MALLEQIPLINEIRDLAKTRRIQIYIVGGFLRDALLGRPGADFDFAVSKDAVGLARVFARRIKGVFVLLDDAHGSARVVKHADGRILTYDFTDFRGKTIAADLSLRDFTVNSFGLDLLTGKDVSPPQAYRDLKAKVIRMAGPQSFTDDPLRLLRAFSLSAQTGFKILAQTAAVIKKQAHLIKDPAMERVREEFFKILNSPRAHANLVQLDRNGMLMRILPQLSVMVKVHQGGYHHLDVWQHTLEVVHQLEEFFATVQDDPKLSAYLNQEIGGGHSRLACLKLAALLHDVGKPQTKKQEKDRMTFHGHEHVGKAIARLACRRLKVSVKERYFCEDAVLNHLRPGYLSNFEKPSAKAVFRYLRDTGTEAAAIAMLAIADQRATQGPLTTKEKTKHHEQICRMVIHEFFNKEEKPKAVKLLTGHDLIKQLKLKPSPLFGKVLSIIEEEQALGKLFTKAEALARAKEIVSKL